MKRIVTLAMTFALSLLVCTDVMANRRNDGDKHNRREQVSSSNRGSGYSRPGYGNNNSNHKPGSGVRPGVGNNHGNHKPGSGVRPGIGNNHGNHKPVHPGWGHGVMRPPVHAGFRPGGGWHRPVPPHGWRPGGRRVPAFRSVLGINFGLSLALSLQSLRASKYVVSGYGGNEVYLTNVPIQGYYWPEATLYYSNGGLAGSQFVYATPGYDMARYNGVYNSLYNAYGAPVSVNGAQVTWFGGNNEFITLNFSPVYSGGTSRFYTTLSFGI